MRVGGLISSLAAISIVGGIIKQTKEIKEVDKKDNQLNKYERRIFRL